MPGAGKLLREWRQRRGLSQFELSLRAEVSPRHVSFVETGRAQPSREMVLKLAEHLDVPLRERNALLLAAGFAPVFGERPLPDPGLAAALQAVQRVLAAHEPYPALAVDRHWNVVASNDAIAPFLSCVAPALRQPPSNVLRNSLHPDGMSSRIMNLPEWRRHLLARLRRQIDRTADPVLSDLLRELLVLPAPALAGAEAPAETSAEDGIAVPLRFKSPAGILNLLSTTMVFGTALDVTLSELAVEAFFPADESTAAALRRLAESRVALARGN